MWQRVVHLNISHNSLRVLPELKLPVLVDLEISHNKLQELPARLFLPELVRLDLSYNNFVTIRRLDSKDLPKLKHLDLSHNGFHGLPDVPHPAIDLPALEELKLAHNKLVELPFQLPLSRLMFLDLRHNKFTTLSRVGPADLPALTQLNISRNDLQMLPELNLPMLQLLDTSHNNLKQFPLSFCLPGLLQLDLSYNKFVEIPLFDPKELPMLKHLKLSHNALRMLPDADLPMLRLSMLERLEMSHTKSHYLPAQLLLPKLLSLDLSHNNLTRIPRLQSSDVPKLQLLNLSHNDLGDVTPAMSHTKSHHLSAQLRLPRLLSLDLSHNNLTQIPRIQSSDVPKLQLLNLSHNDLSDITPAMSRLCGPGRSLESIELADNKQLVLPPSRIIDRGGKEVCQFFVDLHHGHRRCWSQRVLVIGQESAGKTALCQALLGHHCADHAQTTDMSTVGIDTVRWPTVIALPKPNRLARIGHGGDRLIVFLT